MGLAGCVSSFENRSTAGAGPAFSLSGSQPATPETQEHGDGGPCVMEVLGTGLDVQEVEGGLALTFETVAPEQIAELQSAVRRFGEAYENGQHGHHHQHATRAVALARRHRAQQGAFVPLATRVTDVAEGARLFVRAADRAESARLRQRLRADVDQIRAGVCPLLE